MPENVPVEAPGRRVLRVERPRCPDCGSTRLLRYGGSRVDEETTVRYVRCAGCGAKFLLILE